MNHNKLSVKQGSIILNGRKVDCVTDFKYECLTNGMASVTICFDVPIKATELTTESVPEPKPNNTPVSINDAIVDHIVTQIINHI